MLGRSHHPARRCFGGVDADQPGVSAVATAAIAAGVQMMSAPTYATEQSGQRQDARDTRQTGRQDARQEKADCRAGDEKNRPECRQDKRDTKQDARGTARDQKY
ncbi:MAG: hypothetical protein KA142_07205 [Chromatiaceae bacterium]|nr:hypothetical protein [Chromatiaceae bacterium]